MTTTIIRVCDKCGKTVSDKEQFWDIGITCEPQGIHRLQFHMPTKHQRAEWCRPCVDEMGVMVGLLRAETQEQKPTIEDMIREIVNGCIHDEDR